MSSFLAYTAKLSLIVKWPKIALDLNSSNKSGSCQKAFFDIHICSPLAEPTVGWWTLCVCQIPAHFNVSVACRLFDFLFLYLSRRLPIRWWTVYSRLTTQTSHKRTSLETSNNSSLKVPNSVYVCLNVCTKLIQNFINWHHETVAGLKWNSAPHTNQIQISVIAI